MDVRVLAAALIAALLCVSLILTLRPVAIAINLVDIPGGRKRHIGKVPVIGGLGMFLAFAAGIIVAAPTAETLYFLLGALFLVAIGVVDDRLDLAPAIRLSGQFGAVLIMFFGAEVTVQTLGDPLGIGPIEVGRASLVITVFLSTAMINAINMTDGTDGLAAGLSLVPLAGLCVLGYGSVVFAPSLVGLAVVAGFLCFNFPLKVNRAKRTFMGDAGSTFLGFLLTWLLIRATQPPVGIVDPVMAFALAAVPLYDLTSCFLRRVLSGRSPFSADRNHFHHILADTGLHRRRVLAVLLVMSVAVASLCLSLAASGARQSTLLAVWLACGIAIDLGIRGYHQRVLSRTS